LARQPPRILHLQEIEDELLLGSEVIVQLAERDTGPLGDAARRQASVSVLQQTTPGGLEDARACRGSIARASARPALRCRSVDRSHVRTMPGLALTVKSQAVIQIVLIRSTDR
jgi:hypothetical protein